MPEHLEQHIAGIMIIVMGIALRSYRRIYERKAWTLD